MSYAEQLLFARLEPQGEWVREALCARSDNPDLWFPQPSINQFHEDFIKAKAICGRCSVRTECLGWALRTKEPHGIWGGETATAREKLRGVR